MTEPRITLTGPGGECTVPHNVDTATYAEAVARVSTARAHDDQQIAVIPGDGSKPLGVLMVLMPQADADGVYTVHVEEEMVLAWARNIEKARGA